jgi:Asp-tRNA(Asn)/Glu-tRNA(Gln) amidotransferase A subunit family amidase
MPTEHNSPLYKDSNVPVDAASIAILRAAGALILGLFLAHLHLGSQFRPSLSD